MFLTPYLEYLKKPLVIAIIAGLLVYVLHYYENHTKADYDAQSSLKYPLIVSGTVYVALTYLPGLCGFGESKPQTMLQQTSIQLSPASLIKLSHQDAYAGIPDF